MKMDLSNLLGPIRDEIDNDERVRDRVLTLVRECIRKCSKSIKSAHRGEFEEATRLLEEASDLIAEADRETDRSEFMRRSRVLDVAYQELAEASNVISLLVTGRVTPPSRYRIPSRAYLTGLADTVGELRRASLDALRTGRTDDAERYLSYMEHILDELVTFDYPNSLIPELRRKCDVARSLVERTRGDVTTGIIYTRVAENLQSLERETED